MTIERTRRALELAERLLEEAVGEREQLLETWEPDDEALRESVRDIVRSACTPSDVDSGNAIQSLVHRLLGASDTEHDVPSAEGLGLPERYEVHAVIGEGGSSVVFRGRDRESDKPVAIKVAQGGRRMARARREDRIGRGLSHPGIVPILHSGTVGAASYLVMPFVEGGTLRDLMRDRGAVDITIATRLVRSVAEALAHAHECGVVHRDIKPENVLMSGDQPLLSDFGIAREAAPDTNTFRTSEGHVIGTVSYMSPEHAAGGTQDARSDLYSLGCVYYELLTGEPPFLGATAQSVMSKHLADLPGSPARLRAAIPDGIVHVLDRLLAKSPADRFPSAAALLDAMDAVDTSPRAGWRVLGRRRGAAFAALTVAASAVGVVWAMKPAAPELDRSSVVVLPAIIAQDATGYGGADQAFVSELTSWIGIQVVDPSRVFEALQDVSPGLLGIGDAARLAQSFGAGRFVLTRGATSSSPEQYSASVYRTEHARAGPEHVATVPLAAGALWTQSALGQLTDRVLFGGDWWGDGAVGPSGTRDADARRAFGLAMEAAASWDLHTADELLGEAVELDLDFAQAHLERAIVRFILGHSPHLWQESVERAVASASLLSDESRARAEALAAVAGGRFGDACGSFALLTRLAPQDFVGWFGQGECRWADPTIEPDPGGRSAWRFRSSPTEAIRFFERALRLHPRSLAAFRPNSFSRVRERIGAQSQRPKFGQSPSGEIFLGYPMLLGDTLAIVPFSMGEQRLLPTPIELNDAAVTQRRLFRSIAAAAVDAENRNPDALYALAIALESEGDPTAIDTIRIARLATKRNQDRVELAATEAWLAIKTGLGRDTSLVRQGVLLADSLLSAVDPLATSHPDLLASLAALAGEPELAVRYASQTTYVQAAVPPVLDQASRRFALRAATGLTSEEAFLLENELLSLIDETQVEDDVLRIRQTHVEQGAILAYPHHASELFTNGHVFQSPLGLAQLAHFEGDSTAVRERLASYRALFERMPPASVTLDAIAPEFRLRLAVGDSIGALSALMPTLEAIRFADPGVYRQNALRAAVLRRVVLEAAPFSPPTTRLDGASWRADAEILTARPGR